MYRVILVLAVMAGACGGGAAQDEGPETTTTTVAADPGPTTTTTVVATTTTEAAVTLADLSEGQLTTLELFCFGFFDPAILEGELEANVGAEWLPPPFVELVQVAHDAVQSGTDPNEAIGVIGPACDDFGIVAEAVETTTTEAEVPAALTIQIGDLTFAGEVPGCPLDAIDAGEDVYLAFANRQLPLTSSDGGDWEVESLSFGGGAEGTWSFSIVGENHRLYSNDQDGHTLDVLIEGNTGVFTSVFQDQLAGISGGIPDTEGTVTITC